MLTKIKAIADHDPNLNNYLGLLDDIMHCVTLCLLNS